MIQSSHNAKASAIDIANSSGRLYFTFDHYRKVRKHLQ